MYRVVNDNRTEVMGEGIGELEMEKTQCMYVCM